MRVALLGLPGSGKTTLFNAVADHPVDVPPGSVQAETHVQVVRVHDPRLDHLRELFRPKKFTPAGLELWDPPGLPLGSSERDKEKRIRLLASLREVDAYVVVVRAFRTDRYAYEREGPDPEADLGRVVEELITADFVVADGRIRRLRENIRRGARTRSEDERELVVLERCAQRLEAGRDLSDVAHDEGEDKRIRGYQFFARKPFVVLVNGAEQDASGLGRDLPLEPRARLAMDAQIEAEIAAMDEEERPAFMEEFGIGETASDRLVHEIYRAAGLLSFFTVTGDELRAWSLHEGQTALDAAAKVHTDLARGFVRAEVYAYDEIAAAGSEREVKARGLVRLEAKGYVVQDGDIVHVRSNP